MGTLLTTSHFCPSSLCLSLSLPNYFIDLISSSHLLSLLIWNSLLWNWNLSEWVLLIRKRKKKNEIFRKYNVREEKNEKYFKD